MSADDEIRHAYAVLRHVAQERSQLADMETEAKAIIQERMGDDESLVLDGRQVITWKSRATTKFRTADFKAEHPELAEEFTARGSQRYFVLLED